RRTRLRQARERENQQAESSKFHEESEADGRSRNCSAIRYHPAASNIYERRETSIARWGGGAARVGLEGGGAVRGSLAPLAHAQNREWLYFVLRHEFTHIVHLDQARGPAGVLRRIFGGYLVLSLPFTPLRSRESPSLHEPDSKSERLAVYSESGWNKGYGRLGQSH